MSLLLGKDFLVEQEDILLRDQGIIIFFFMYQPHKLFLIDPVVYSNLCLPNYIFHPLLRI